MALLPSLRGAGALPALSSQITACDNLSLRPLAVTAQWLSFVSLRELSRNGSKGVSSTNGASEVKPIVPEVKLKWAVEQPRPATPR